MLGHGRDPVHPFSDAGMLAKEMPNARLIEADSLVELRMRPERLTGEIAAFLDEVWKRRRGQERRRRRTALVLAPPKPAGGGPRRSGRPSARPPRQRAPARRRRRRRSGLLAGREQFDFVQRDLARRCSGVPIEAAGAPLIQTVTNRYALFCVAQADLGVRASSIVTERLSGTHAGSVIDAGSVSALAP